MATPLDTTRRQERATAQGKVAPTLAEHGGSGRLPDAASIVVVRGLGKIRRAPRWDAALAGLVHAGQSVRLRSTKSELVAASGGCPGGWYAVEPEGFLCHDADTSLDPSSIAAQAAADARPRRNADYPFHYGVSRGAPRYARIPTRDEQLRAEPWLRAPAARRAAERSGRAASQTPQGSASSSEHHAPALPESATSPLTAGSPSDALRAWLSTRDNLRDDLDAYPTMKLAWRRELFESDRRFLLTPELLLVPADRVQRAPELGGLGVDLVRQPELTMPFAIVVRPSPRRAADGVPVGGTFRRGELLQLDECAARDGSAATRPRQGRRSESATTDTPPQADTPCERRRKGVLVTSTGEAVASDAAVQFDPIPRPTGIGEHDKWVLVRVNAGTLVALEGDRPVYAAPISAGVHGVTDGELRTNPGRYRISSKAITADMGGEAGDGAWRSRDVPWVAYYDGSYALHGAWWHDSFGRPRSHGCVNLTPADARWLFEWLDPVLPDGWHAVVADPPRRPGTLVVIRR